MSRKAGELRAMNDANLAKEMEETHRQLFTLRFQVVTRQTANHRALRDTRRKIARLKTIERERQLLGEQEG